MKFAQTMGELQNKILLPVIALKIEPIDISKWNFAESFIILFSRSLFKMVTFGWNLSKIWWFFEKKKVFKRGYPQIILKTVRVRAFAQNKLFRYFLIMNILQVTARLYLLYFPRYGWFLVYRKFSKKFNRSSYYHKIWQEASSYWYNESFWKSVLSP